MNIRLRLLATAMLYIFTASAFAHPGPHSHIGVSEVTWHAFFGWEFWLAMCVIGVAWYVNHRLRNARIQ
ncbi:MAG: hypothetical protein HY273_15610 [Gammaproteobacteria bacterium]|nr:hypothetical protein [Gammaproteobacteria bacterium]